MDFSGLGNNDPSEDLMDIDTTNSGKNDDDAKDILSVRNGASNGVTNDNDDSKEVLTVYNGASSGVTNNDSKEYPVESSKSNEFKNNEAQRSTIEDIRTPNNTNNGNYDEIQAYLDQLDTITTEITRNSVNYNATWVEIRKKETTLYLSVRNKKISKEEIKIKRKMIDDLIAAESSTSAYIKILEKDKKLVQENILQMMYNVISFGMDSTNDLGGNGDSSNNLINVDAATDAKDLHSKEVLFDYNGASSGLKNEDAKDILSVRNGASSGVTNDNDDSKEVLTVYNGASSGVTNDNDDSKEVLTVYNGASSGVTNNDSKEYPVESSKSNEFKNNEAQRSTIEDIRTPNNTNNGNYDEIQEYLDQLDKIATEITQNSVNYNATWVEIRKKETTLYLSVRNKKISKEEIKIKRKEIDDLIGKESSTSAYIKILEGHKKLVHEKILKMI